MDIPNVAISDEQIATFCQNHHIRTLALFGSVLRPDFRPDSDIDVLVEFEPEIQVTLFEMGAVQVGLSALLGREVDLKTEGFLSPYFREQVVRAARVIYRRT